MKDRDWKKINKPSACRNAPWAIFIEPKKRPEVLRKIRQETIDAYGYSMDECVNRKICISKTCIGRDLPWLSKTAKPYLLQLGIKEGEQYFVKTDCSTCPLYNTCTNVCNQVYDFIEKDKIVEPEIKYEEQLDIVKTSEQILQESVLKVKKEDVPWDILSERKKEVINKYLFEQRDFRYISETSTLLNQAAVKYEFYSSLSKLSEFAIFRDFIKNSSEKLTSKQLKILQMVYLENKKLVQVAKELKISKQAVQQIIMRVVKKHNIKWYKFVRKKNNKITYSTLEIFK